MKKHIASCSFGKDSLAMVLKLLDGNCPLDEVMFYDTGMEFKAIYNLRDKLLPILESRRIAYTELKPEKPFLWKMFEKPVNGKNGFHYGYSWCGGTCRWGTTDKLKALDRYAEQQDAIVYVGIALDETDRILKEHKSYKRLPLVDWSMTERDCLQYCRARGWGWNEDDIDLYDILDRVSCWCCSNKNRKELRAIYQHLPDYWERLKELQSRTDRPMKHFSNAKYGDYGNVFQMEKAFKQEFKQ